MINQQRPLHGHLSAFVDWIATEDVREQAIRAQAEEIRSRIGAKAKDDGLRVRSTPWSGSFRKRTGLRRHMRGKNPIPGQDVDLPFVLSPATSDHHRLDSLVGRFEKYAMTSYPDTQRCKTKSSVKLKFGDPPLAYDLVPMLAGENDETQYIFRSDGEVRKTSVQKHIEFITRRTGLSKESPGCVQFNEMVRLFKWWREVVTGGDIEALPTIVVELLCALAFDKCGVERTYPDTLQGWFGFLANVVKHRTPVYFTDYTPWPSRPAFEPWAVVDPVNTQNNVASDCTAAKIQTLAGWLADARDNVAQAIAQDLNGDEKASVEALAPVFGNPIVHHGSD